MSDTILYIHMLKEELSVRKSRNARYSMRSFARSLQVDIGTLSRIFSQKLIPSPEVAQRITQLLQLEPDKKFIFLASIERDRLARQDEKAELKYQEFESEYVTTIGSWYHYALLELTQVKSFKSTVPSLAKRLAISPIEARDALNRLVRLGLLSLENGVYSKTAVHLTTSNKSATTAALKALQSQFLQKAHDALHRDPIEARNFSGITMAIDPQKIPFAKQLIQEFSRNLCAILESGSRESLYQLQISLFSLDANPHYPHVEATK